MTGKTTSTMRDDYLDQLKHNVQRLLWIITFCTIWGIGIGLSIIDTLHLLIIWLGIHCIFKYDPFLSISLLSCLSFVFSCFDIFILISLSTWKIEKESAMKNEVMTTLKEQEAIQFLSPYFLRQGPLKSSFYNSYRVPFQLTQLTKKNGYSRVLLVLTILPFLLRLVATLLHIYQFQRLKKDIRELYSDETIMMEKSYCDTDKEELEKLLDLIKLPTINPEYDILMAQTLSRGNRTLQPYVPTEPDIIPSTVDEALIAEKRLASSERMEKTQTPSSWLYVRAFDEDERIKNSNSVSKLLSPKGSSRNAEAPKSKKLRKAMKEERLSNKKKNGKSVT